MNNKGQENGAGMVIISAFIVLAIIGIVQIISVTITSNVGAAIETSIPLDLLTTINETVNQTDEATDWVWATNTTTLAQDGFITNSEVIANTTNHSKILTRNTDYFITLVGGVSGVKTTQANLTLVRAYNGTQIEVTYNTNEETAYHTAKDNLVGNNLSSFELGGTAQIVFAATVILISVFGLLAIMRGR